MFKLGFLLNLKQFTLSLCVSFVMNPFMIFS